MNKKKTNRRKRLHWEKVELRRDNKLYEESKIDIQTLDGQIKLDTNTLCKENNKKKKPLLIFYINFLVFINILLK